MRGGGGSTSGSVDFGIKAWRHIQKVSMLMALGVVARPSPIIPPLLVHQASNRAGLSFTLVKVRRAFAETRRRSLSGCLLSTGNIQQLSADWELASGMHPIVVQRMICPVLRFHPVDFIPICSIWHVTTIVSGAEACNSSLAFHSSRIPHTGAWIVVS